MIVMARRSITDHGACPLSRAGGGCGDVRQRRWQTHVEHDPAIDSPNLQRLEDAVHILQGRAPDVRVDLPFGGECERLGQIPPSAHDRATDRDSNSIPCAR